MKTIGEKLKELRLNADLSQAEFSKIINVTPSAIGMYEQDRRVPRDEIKKRISNFYSISVDNIFFT